MNILITGGAGFIGSNLIEVLKKTYPSYTLWVIDDYSSGSKSNHHPGVHYIKGKTSDIYHLMQDKPVPEVIFHLGEFSRIRPSFELLDRVWESNCHGSFQVIKYCQAHQAKLIYTGSSSKFGAANNQHLSPYAWSKAKNIELIKNYAQWFGLNYCIGYLCNVYGQKQIDTGAYGTVIGIFERLYRDKKPLTVIQPGTQRRCFTHVSDICQGLIKLMNHSKNAEFILGHPKDFSILEVAALFQSPYEMIAEQPGERFIPVQINPQEWQALDWSPFVTLEGYINNFLELNNS